MEYSEKEFKWANFGIRWGALLIDINIVLLVLLTSGEYVLKALSEFNLKDLGVVNFVFLFFGYLLGLPIIGIFIRTLFESSKFQGTPGKVAVGIKVVDYKGDRISFSRALKRNFAKIISTLFYFGYLKVMFSEKRQGFHDYLAKTYVIKIDG